MANNLFDSKFIDSLPYEALKSLNHAILARMQQMRREGRVQEHQVVGCYKDNLRKFGKFDNDFMEYNKNLLKHLSELIDADWSDVFSCGDEDKRYYVYMHHYKQGKRIDFDYNGVSIHTKGLPFYIGKGTGTRAYDLNRNQGHGQILKQLKKEQAKDNDIVSIVANGLSEDDALILESKLIYFFGTKYEKGRKGILVNLDIPKRPF